MNLGGAACTSPPSAGGHGHTPRCLHDVLAAHADRALDAPAILAPGRAPLTYGLLHRHVHDVVGRLRARALGRHDRIAVLLPNGPEMATAVLAVAAGATCVPLDPLDSAAELDSLLTALGARAILVQAGAETSARAVALRRGLQIIELSPVVGGAAGLFTLTGDDRSSAVSDGFGRPDDVSLLVCTAGTTAQPKIVPLTHATIVAAASVTGAALSLAESDRCLNVMPLFHSHGLKGTLFPSMVAGASVACLPGLAPPEFHRWLRDLRPTWYTAVPTIHRAILKEAASLPRDHSLRFIRSASAATPPRLVAELERVFGVPVVESYGGTEASMLTCNVPRGHQRKTGSVGIVVGPEVAIMGELGALLPAGEVGEIVARGASVISGYEGDPAATRAAFTDGWFRTGDQGYFDTDGYLFVTGRIKDIINRGGQKISPREVEDVIRQHPHVEDVAVCPVPHVELGEDVAAAIVLREGVAVPAEDIRRFAASRLSSFKVPRQVVFVTDLPRSATGKVQRSGLAAKLGLGSRGGGTFAAPRTHVEAQLVEIWSRILGLAHVSVRDDFFALGGHSLQAVALLAHIEKVFGQTLPPQVLLQAPTIAQLAGILGQGGSPMPWSSLLAIQPRGSRPPFYCVHAHGGHALVFKALAERLGAEQPFFALQAQGLDGIRARHDRIEAMAADYVREIRTRQPSGPYCIGGYCFGGVVAFEMAHQLHVQGQEVALLALIDAYAPIHSRGQRWARRATHRARTHVEAFVRLGPREKLGYVVAKAETLVARLSTSIENARQRRRIPPSAALRALRQVQRANVAAYRRYVPKVYPAAITLFRPSQQPPEYSRDLDMGWGTLTSGGLETHEVPGRHLSIVLEPHVAILAEQLRDCLSRATTPAARAPGASLPRPPARPG